MASSASVTAPSPAAASSACAPTSVSLPSPPPARVSFEIFEFFAGLGGFHLSLPPTLPVHSITAVEIDQRAAETYRLNLHAHAARTRTADAAAGGEAPAAGEAASASASAATAGMSVRSRIKHNRKAFFEQQQLLKKQKAEASVVEDVGGAEAVAAAAASAATLAQATPAAVQAAPATSVSSSRLPVASTPLSSFNLPPPVFDPRSVVQPDVPSRLLVRLLEQLSPSALTSTAPDLRPSIWMMSPPCQPFTHTLGAKQLDTEDKRNAAFLFILATLRAMAPQLRPAYIFLENVKHFFGSAMHANLVKTLRECGYEYKQYILSPMQWGIPNHRTRFYLSARKLSEQEKEAKTEQEWDAMEKRLIVQPPGLSASSMATAVQQVVVEDEETSAAAADDAVASSSTAAASSSADAASATLPSAASLPCLIPPSTLAPYLDSPSFHSAQAAEGLLVPLSTLAKGFAVSVVSPADRRTFCFTGGYGKVVHISTGSFLLFKGPQIDRGEDLTTHPIDRSASGLSALAGSVRFFSPMELLRLFGFPEWYRFPAHFTCVHAYKLIGNSINVTVVASILAEALKEHCA